MSTPKMPAQRRRDLAERRRVTSRATRDVASLHAIDTFLRETAATPGSKLPSLVTPEGGTVELPARLVPVLREAVRLLTQGADIVVSPRDRDLTTQQSADMLGVSRPYLVRLLESGAIPFSTVGTHRRVRLVDLLDYKEQRDKERRTRLRGLTRFSREIGLYDERHRAQVDLERSTDPSTAA